MSIAYPQCWAGLRVIFDGLGGDDSKELILNDVRPTEATVHLNGYNMADTFELAFNATILPFSPEVIRALSVDIYMFNGPRLLTNSEARDYFVPENLLIHGLMDDEALDYTESGRIIRITGRDQTALLADVPWPPGQTIATGEDLVTTVQGMIDLAQNGLGVKMTAIDSDDLPAPTVSGIGEGITSKTNRDAIIAQKARIKAANKKLVKAKKPSTSSGRTKTTKFRIPVPSGRSYWDAISELCLQYGHLCYVQGLNVVIRRPQSISEETVDQALRFVYGRNLAELRIKRHHGREAAPQIVASFYDAKDKKFIEVRWPKTDKAWILANAASSTKGTGKTTVNFRRILLPPGIRDQGAAEEICKAAYLNYGRSEAQISFSTKTLTDIDGKQVLKARPGNVISIAFDGLDGQDLRKATVEERVTILRDLGYRAEVANIVAQNYEKLDQLRRPVYAKELSFSYSKDDGISLEAQAINFVVPKRDDPDAVSSA